MIKRNVEAFVERMRSYLPVSADYHGKSTADRDDSVELIVQDLQTQYIDRYEHLSGLGKRYLDAWDLVIYARLKAMTKGFDTGKRQDRGGQSLGNDASSFDDLLQYWGRNVSSRGDIGLIYFGQKRVASTFAEARSMGRNETAGVPEINGKPLRVVASLFNERGLGIDRNPLKIFYSDAHQCWVAANNRSYAAHCMAGTRPLRLWPDAADTGELNRLTETLDNADVTLTAGVRVQLPRTLPSLEMPVTNGQQDMLVTDVVRVPETFYLDWSR